MNLHLTGTLALAPEKLGLVYLVFIPAIFTTPYAAKAVSRFGPKGVFRAASVATLAGILLTLIPVFWPVVAGLAVSSSPHL